MAESSGLQTPLWRAIAVFRIAALLYVAVLVVRNVGAYERPMLAWPVLAVMAGWTVFTTYAYAVPARRRPPLLIADLLITMAVLAASVWVVGRVALEEGRPTLAVAWHVAPVLAWAVAGGRRWGIAAALAMGITDLTVRAHYDQAAFTGTVLMVLAATAVGYLVGLAEVSQQRLERAVQLEATNRERERLARDIHDSVLQVLALVKRRGAGLDGEAGELARLAGEQEAALRTLVTGRTAERQDEHAEADLMRSARAVRVGDGVGRGAGRCGPAARPRRRGARRGRRGGAGQRGAALRARHEGLGARRGRAGRGDGQRA